MSHIISHKHLPLAVALSLTIALWLIDHSNPRKPNELRLGLVSFTQPPLPVPSPAEVGNAKKILAEIYRDEFAQANTSSGAQKLSQLQRLSQKIAAVAAGETDPTKLYAIFEVAVEISKQSGDIENTSKLIDQFQRRFAIDSHVLHSDAATYWLTQIPKYHKTLPEQRSAYGKLGQHLTARSNVAVQDSQWDAAQRFYELAAQAYSKSTDKAQATKSNQLARQMKELSLGQMRIDRLLTELADSDDKPRLNFEIGSFYCFEVGNWKTGLPYLKEGNDKGLAAAAAADIDADEDSWESTGDLWWDLSQEPTYKQHAAAIQKRAVTNYSTAMKKATGLSSAKITKRILTAGGSVDDVKALAPQAAPSPAVDRGLKWLAKQQKSDGSWSLVGPYQDGASSEDRTAATAMALLAFLQAGYGPQVGDYKQNVKQGLNFLLIKQDKAGFFATGEISHNQTYSQALASLAVLEAFSLTQDAKLKTSVTQAVRYAQWSQGQQGGWRYAPREDSDTSVTGWYLTLLTKAKEANFEVSAGVFEKAEAYLKTVSHDASTRYSYLRQDRPSLSMTAEALRCRLEMGMSHEDPSLLIAVNDDLLPNLPKSDADVSSVYFCLHATHVLRRVGGQLWPRWRDGMRQTLHKLQEAGGAETGSWSPDKDQFGPSGGRLYVTCFNLYSLQIADQAP